MAASADDSCERLEGTEQLVGDMEKTDLHLVDADGSGGFGDMHAGVTGETQDLTVASGVFRSVWFATT